MNVRLSKNGITFDRIIRSQLFIAHSKADVMSNLLILNLSKSDFPLLRYGQSKFTSRTRKF